MTGRSETTGPSGAAPRASVATVAGAVLRRPRLWWTALGAVRRLAAPGWWHRRPYLPLPDERLWAFRMVTAYGRPDAVPDPDDVVAYLEWCRTVARPPSGGGYPGAGPGPGGGRPPDPPNRTAAAPAR